jgi:xanthine/CO dehydrogenase XdhC/CoxF family maturation factor
LKHWQELGQILDRLLELARADQPAALATVTRIRGSAYRRPGARLLIEPGGSALGGVSGGCLEADVREVGSQVLRTGLSRVLHYETGGDDARVWGLGLGCDGEVDVAVQPIAPAAALGTWARVRERLEEDAPFALSSVLAEGAPPAWVVTGESGRLAGGLDDPAAEVDVQEAAAAALRSRRSAVHAAGPLSIFTEVLVPPPTLLVCGAGDDARPLVTAAHQVGFRVVVADHRDAFLTALRFPHARRLLLVRPDDEAAPPPADARTFAVVMTHSLKRDTDWVRRLAATDVPYLGVLGPRARTERIVSELRPGNRDRVYGPVGLDLGAEGPEQVALSVLAEVLAVASGREPRHLRERAEAVHA